MIFNKKAFSILVFVLLFFVSIVGVAADNIDDITVGEENQIYATENVQGTFTDLNTAMGLAGENGVVNLTGDVQRADGEGFVNGININQKNLTINGNGYSIIGTSPDGTTGRIFYINVPEVTLINILFINGNSTSSGSLGYGGAIYAYNNAQNLTMVDCTFDNNVATIGSSLFNVANYVTMNGTTVFTNNYASGSAAVHNRGDNFTMVGTTSFINNSAGSSYGAFGNSGDNFIMNGTNIFMDNSAGSSYGAFGNSGDNFTMTGTNHFINNSAGSSYGAFGNSGDNFIMNGTNIFMDNSAGSSYGAFGNSGDNFTMVGSTSFINNSAQSTGAFYNNGINFIMNGTNIFMDNFANAYGALVSSGVNFTMIGINTFINNVAVNNYGAIRSSGADFTMTGTNTFENNKAGQDGGAIYSSGDNFEISGESSFVGNEAGYSGGAIYNTGNDAAILGTTSFTNNKANRTGGAIYVRDGHRFTIEGAYFESNVAVEDGGAIYIRELDVFVVGDSEFANNSAGISGGAVYNRDAHNMVFGDVNFTGNNAPRFGGAIYSMDSFNFIMNRVIFEANSAYRGGAINNEYSDDMFITESEFINNVAEDGTAVWLERGLAIIDISEFTGEGTIIYNDLGKMYLNNNTINSDAPGIYNYGTILSEVIMTINNNGSYIGYMLDDFLLDAFLTDDNGNVIIGQNITIQIGDIEDIPIADSLANGTYEGVYTIMRSDESLITGLYAGGNNLTVRTARLSVAFTYYFETNDVDKYYMGSQRLEIYFGDSLGRPAAGEEIKITINGVTYTKTTDANGTAYLNIKLDPGTYTAVTTATRTENITQRSVNNSVVVKTTIFGDDVFKFFRNGTEYYVTLLDGEGNPLVGANATININGVTYQRTTNGSGVAKLNINLDPGYHILTAEHPNGLKTSNIVYVIPVLEAYTYSRADGGVDLVVRVVDGQGTPVQGENIRINIHGWISNLITDMLGFVRLDVSLESGHYLATAYSSATDVSTIVIVP
ncbi:hypothetical protein [Methanobrevibacter sp. DSM 116169]|uniref:hypothetical protein n=1 Tax=Methanobrevibacter sp. DSM 116169 TaxID=3242727 RepID=UPI0038FC5CAB